MTYRPKLQSYCAECKKCHWSLCVQWFDPYVCTMDLSKAFDWMNHFVIFTKLFERKLPSNYCATGKVVYHVFNQISSFYKLSAGVRQWGILSSVLFAIFIDVLDYKIKDANVDWNYVHSILCMLMISCFRSASTQKYLWNRTFKYWHVDESS